MNITVKGQRDLAQVAAALKASGNRDLRKELLRGIREQGKPAIADIRTNARTQLPGRGGLADIIAGSKFAVRTRATGTSPRVRLTGTSRHDVTALDEGTLRHPVYGSKRWTAQKVTPGWFSTPVLQHAPRMRRNMRAIVRGVAKKIEKAG
jgi:hypothetical protein